MHTDRTEADIAAELEGLRAQLVAHPVFSQVDTLNDLQLFMEAHVFAVWDFMSLVKRLQSDFTVTSVPWTPPAWPLAARLMNDIVTGEESDKGPDGKPLSHYELYLNAMAEVGASTEPIREFVAGISSTMDLDYSLETMQAPVHVRQFVASTLDTACFASTAAVVGSFFYGREDVIPQMFQEMLDDWGIDPATVPQLVYYLERHIELDADEHGPAAQLIVDEILAADPDAYDDIVQAARQALEMRIKLWDGVHVTLQRAKAARAAADRGADLAS
jgi:hypothetical protein